MRAPGHGCYTVWIEWGYVLNVLLLVAIMVTGLATTHNFLFGGLLTYLQSSCVHFMQWSTTRCCLYCNGKIITVLIDLMSKVYANHPGMVLYCTEILVHGKTAQVRTLCLVGIIYFWHAVSAV